MNDLKLYLIKLFEKYIAQSVVKSMIKNAIMRAVGVAGGLPGMIIGVVVGKLIKLGLIQAKHAENKAEAVKQVTEEKTQYDKVINDPKSTAEDIKSAGPDFLG